MRAPLLAALVVLPLAAAAQPPPRTERPAQPQPRADGPRAHDGIERPVQPRIPRGVLRPPGHVDPGILAPVPMPRPGTTPVIPPPGTPGGDPAPRPR
ncbi:hypothetical protein [Falsiroseomonas stagni]|uniref:Uncharacterized protein n=1 Tax=Falsiroseomonas stagni DSM 19981 TaxID=1123062 RepID=A0A1I4CC12_9PROT|nr:hypothetical protein [Falsiroseomonas stagni]SFK77857.1 hypothetical protein SAMN02745775_10775 [Falsiroseomonas stagni DSM 19981]